MLDTERGKIKYTERARQINDFSGLRFENITPTDCDGIIEYKNNLYILFEVKYKGVDMPYGQRLALERMCNDFQKMGKKCIVLLIEHDIYDTNLSVDVANCKVRQVYADSNQRWRKPTFELTTKEACDLFIKNKKIETLDNKIYSDYEEQFKQELLKMKNIFNNEINKLENKINLFLKDGKWY